LTEPITAVRKLFLGGPLSRNKSPWRGLFMQTRYLAGIPLALLLGLGGCGGGSSLPTLSNTSGTQNPIGSSTPPPSASSTSPPGAQPNATKKTTEQLVAQGGLGFVRDLSLQVTVHRTSTLSTMKSVLALRKQVTTSALRPQDFTIGCTDATTEDWSTSGTVTTFTIDTYYDAACTKLLQNTKGTFDTTAGTMAAQATTYAIGGAVTEYDTLIGELTTNAFAVEATASPTQGAAPFLHFGLTCLLSTSFQCGSGDVIDQAAFNQSIGAINQVSLGTTYAGGVTTSVGTGTETLYNSALHGMTLSQGPATSPAWVISGGTSEAFLTITVTQAQNSSGQLTSFNIHETDALDETATNIVENSSGGFDGTITQTGMSTPVATFSVDGNGDGTIHYDNGTTGTITGFIIIT
jgi:hypothetical protein